MARKKKLTIDKYNYGSYVIMNQQRGEPATPKDNGQSALSGLTTGASIGTSIMPGIGTAVGAVVGGIGGLLFGNAKNKRRQREQRKLDLQSLNSFTQQYNANIDSVNENPYGTYADGGDVGLNLLPINIEAGEILVDPQSGKIKREFNGINPETGGKYLPHAKGRKKDTPNNIVTAEEGSFVITKAKAKEYKDALNNNDKLAQNSIMHNIRNKKRQSMKFADGGLVQPVTTFAGVQPNLNLSTSNRNLITPVTTTGVTLTKPNTGPVKLAPLSLNVAKTPTINNSPQSLNFNWGNLVQALPAVVNLVQGFSAPNYMQQSNTPSNPFTNRILGNMPREMDYSPLFNRIYRDRNTAYNVIDNTTNSSAVARANKLNVMANTQRGIQDVYFQGEDYNNRIRMQRAGLYNNLGQQELARFADDRSYNYQVDMVNRQMQEGRRQQINYGLTQIGQLYNQLDMNRQLRNRDADLMSILPEIYPAIAPYLENYSRRRSNGSR